MYGPMVNNFHDLFSNVPSTFVTIRTCANGKNSIADGKSGSDENYFYEYATFSNFYILL